MKKTLILSILIALFLFTALPVSAKSNNEENNHENSFSESFNRFVKDRRDEFNRFRHRDDDKKKKNREHEEHHENDEHEDDCNDDNQKDDECVVSAPEFGSVTGPITFLVSSGAMLIAKKRIV